MKELSIKEKSKRYDEVLEKARQLCAYPTSKPFISDLQDLFPELQESEDEVMRKKLLELIAKHCGKTCEMYLWFEKQGEQNHVDNVEPKFKVGDWAVNEIGLVRLIIAADNRHYKCIRKEFNDSIDEPFIIVTKYADEYWHKWTIQDAKDGDVLTYSDSKHTWLCIFKELKNQRCYDYCSYSNKDEVGFWPRSNWNYDKTLSYKPATKEQRDTLMKAIADAGYIFDFEKKELKKIEQKQDVDIQINPEEYINDMGGNGCYLKNTTQASAWSEEDDKIIEEIINDIECARAINYHAPKEDYEFRENWLKSLKERMKGE